MHCAGIFLSCPPQSQSCVQLLGMPVPSTIRLFGIECLLLGAEEVHKVLRKCSPSLGLTSLGKHLTVFSSFIIWLTAPCHVLPNSHIPVERGHT